MNEYTVNDSDLKLLITSGGGFAVFASLGSACLGVYNNVQTSLAFAPKDLEKSIAAAWAVKANVALLGTGIFYAFAIIAFLLGYHAITQIKVDTDYADGQNYIAPKFVSYLGYVIVLIAGIILGAISIGFFRS